MLTGDLRNKVDQVLQSSGGPAAEGAFARHMAGARFTIPTPNLLAKVVDLLDTIPMDERDTKGDLYEYMLGKIASAGQNGQFRTPRHKSDNLNTPHYYVTKATEGLSEAGKAVGRLVPPNSILVTCIAGSPDCIGNAAMADREVAFNQQINAFIPVELDAHFAYAQIVVGKKLIQGASTNGMKGMVSKSRFEAIEFMAPPLPL